MSTNDQSASPDKGPKGSTKLEHEGEGAAAGAIAGGVLGAVGGPPGAVVGAIVGAIAGALAGAAMDDGEAENAADDEKLDEAIGVEGGELGAPNLKHPPAKVGAFSGGSMGSAGAPAPDSEEPAEGPIQSVD